MVNFWIVLENSAWNIIFCRSRLSVKSARNGTDSTLAIVNKYVVANIMCTKSQNTGIVLWKITLNDFKITGEYV